MMYLINFIESFISVLTISELCNIRHKKSFIYITSFLSFLASIICDFYNRNSWPLLISYILIWFAMSSLYTKQSYIYNLFVAIVCNYIINLSLFIPLIYIYHNNALLASIIAKIIHFIISYLFILYRKRYSYIENKYWVPVLIITACCMIIMENELYLLFLGKLTFNSGLIIVLSLIIITISLFFFHIIERFNEEKNTIFEQLKREQYRNLSYDIINYAKKELDYMHHGLRYKLMLIQAYLDNNKISDAKETIKNFICDINKYKNIVLTGNEVFDALFSIKTSHLNYVLVRCINISKKDFYNDLEFINIILELLTLIKDNLTIHFSLEEIGQYCIIKITSYKNFYDKLALDQYLLTHKKEFRSYTLNNNNNLYQLKISMVIKDEKYM